MKKLLLVLVLCLGFVGVAKAESINIFEELQKIPSLKQGIAYSISDSTFKYCSTMELVKWNNINLEAGYIPDDELIGAVTYKLLALKDYTTIPILDLVEFNAGIYAGSKRIGLGAGNAKGNNEWDWGLCATILSIKF